MHYIQSTTTTATTEHGSVMYCLNVLLILEENSLCTALKEPSQSRLSFAWHILELAAAFQECVHVFSVSLCVCIFNFMS